MLCYAILYYTTSPAKGLQRDPGWWASRHGQPLRQTATQSSVRRYPCTVSSHVLYSQHFNVRVSIRIQIHTSIYTYVPNPSRSSSCIRKYTHAISEAPGPEQTISLDALEAGRIRDTARVPPLCTRCNLRTPLGVTGAQRWVVSAPHCNEACPLPIEPTFRAPRVTLTRFLEAPCTHRTVALGFPEVH